MKLPVLKAFIAGLALFFGKAGELMKTLWLPALLMMAAAAFIMPRYIEITLPLSRDGAGDNPAQVFSAMAPAFKYMGLLYLAIAILYPMMKAGNLKYIIRGQTRALPFYLQFGMDEVRILITYILVFIMLALANVTGAIGVVVVSVIAALGGKAIGGAIMAAAILAFIAALVWFLLRMSIAVPASVGARRIGIAESWRLTRGNAWRLLFYWILWGVVFSLIGGLYIVLAVPEFVTMMKETIAAAGESPEVRQEIESRWAAAQLDLWDRSSPGYWRYLGGTYLHTLIYTSLANVASGVAYRYLSAEETAE